MYRSLLALCILSVSPVVFAEDQLVHTFIEPSCCESPTTFEFFAPKEKAVSWATSEAYQPAFSTDLKAALAKVEASIKTDYPDMAKFQVFQAAVTWEGLEQPDGSIKGFELIFVRSQIQTATLVNGKSKIDAPEGKKFIIPCYSVVLPDGSVVKGKIKKT